MKNLKKGFGDMTIQKMLEPLLQGIGIAFQFIWIVVPDEWKIALFIIAVIFALFFGTKGVLKLINKIRNY